MPAELRYEPWFLPFSVPFGLGPKQSDVRIVDDVLYVDPDALIEACTGKVGQ